jgi:hypothetical protein
VLVLTLLTASQRVIASSMFSGDANKNCGTRTVAEMLRSGWQFVKRDFIAKIDPGGHAVTLRDGSRYRADMTVGIFEGDEALLFRKHVNTKKISGYIYNLCAGGFDAWVTPTHGSQ